MESYNKLVRDKIPEHLDSRGISYEKRIANPEEYKEELFKKLDEETKEFLELKNVEELADILEVIEAIKKLSEFANVEEVKSKKL
ncbi:MAG: nucleoside triphosphate pyrophosphohydrolase [Candidatus Paceibacterota bacterium]|jgi:predicted house-cleaning noncanonical NTP pyrophosphatase (MazG superfamily)